jgi:hypothetical protein
MQLNEVEIFKESLDVSRIVMIITIIMAVISVVFSALTLAFQRSHNRRTVKPYCFIKIEYIGNGIRFITRNAGLGPMIIDRIYVISNSKSEELNKRIVLASNEECIVYEGNNDANTKVISIRIVYHDIYEKKYEITG